MNRTYLLRCVNQGRRQFSQVFEQPQQWTTTQVSSVDGWYPYCSTYPEPELEPEPYSEPYQMPYSEAYSTPYNQYYGDTSQIFYPQSGWVAEYPYYNCGVNPYSQPQYNVPPYYNPPQFAMTPLPCQQQYQYSSPVQYSPTQYSPSQWYRSSPVDNQRQTLAGTDADVYTATNHFNRWLTKRITETSTPRELLLLIQQKGKFFDRVHLGAGYVQAARMYKNKNVNEDKDSITQIVEQLCLRSTPEMMRLMDGWTLSNSMWGLVKTKFHTTNLGKAVSKFLVAEVARKAESFKSQELSITAWALARMNIHSENVMSEISRVALQRKRKLGSQAISNLLWAFSSLNQYERELFEALVAATADSFEDFDPQGLSNVMWALAHAGYYDERFMQQVCDFLCRVEYRSFNMFPVGLSQIIVSLGRFNYRHEQLLDRIIEKTVYDFSKIDQQSLSNAFFYWALLEQDYGKIHTLVKEIQDRYEQGGLQAFSSADLQRIYEGVQLFECQGIQVNFQEDLLSEARQQLLGSYSQTGIPQKVQDMIHDVVDILTRMGEKPKPSQVVEHPVYEIPIGLEIDGKLLALFTSGSRMYTCTKPYKKLGLLEAKQKLLKHYGWKIVDLPLHDWERLDSVQEQENYLKKKLNLALGTRKYEVTTGLESEDSAGRIVSVGA